MDTADKRKSMTGIWNDQEGRYDSYTPKSKYELVIDESAAVTERLEKLVSDIEQALPNILQLTNQLTIILSNSAALTSNLNAVALDTRPAVSNLALVTARLDHPARWANGCCDQPQPATGEYSQQRRCCYDQRQHQPHRAGGEPGPFTGQPCQPDQQSQRPGASEHQRSGRNLPYDCQCRFLLCRA